MDLKSFYYGPVYGCLSRSMILMMCFLPSHFAAVVVNILLIAFLPKVYSSWALLIPFCTFLTLLLKSTYFIDLIIARHSSLYVLADNTFALQWFSFIIPNPCVHVWRKWVQGEQVWKRHKWVMQGMNLLLSYPWMTQESF